MILPKAVLLDLDGTLTDSGPGILGSYNAMLREMGHEPDPAVDLTFVIGPVMADVMPQVLAHYGDTRVEQAITVYRRFYSSGGLFEATVYDGVEPLLKALKAAGCRLFLATAKRLDFAERMLEHFGLATYFEALYGSIPGGALDHKPELIAHILLESGVDPEDAVMVGDRHYDITGAHANRVRAIGALWGYGGLAELEQAGADELVENIPELEVLLLGSRVRDARPDDLEGVMLLYRSFPSYSPEYDAAAAAPVWQSIQSHPGMTVVVAEADGMLISCCTLVVVPNLTYRGQPWAVIENVVTHPDYRERGLGRRVIAYATELAWEAGCYKVGLAAGSKQEPTQHFYEGVGFRRGTKTYFEKRKR